MKSLSEEELLTIEDDYFDNVSDNPEFVSNLFEEGEYTTNIEEKIAKEYNSINNLKNIVENFRIQYKFNTKLNSDFAIIPSSLKEEIWKKGLSLILENGEAHKNLQIELWKIVKNELITNPSNWKPLSLFWKLLSQVFESPEETKLKSQILDGFKTWILPKDITEKKLFLKTLSKAKVWKYKNKYLNVEEYLSFMNFSTKTYFWISIDEKIIDQIKYDNILDSNDDMKINSDFQVSVNLNKVNYVMWFLQSIMHEYSHALTYKFMTENWYDYSKSFEWPNKKIAMLIKEGIAEDFAHYVFSQIADENKDRTWVNHWFDIAAEIRLYDRIYRAEQQDLNYSNLPEDIASSSKNKIQNDREQVHIYAKGYIMIKVIREKLGINQFRLQWLPALMKVAFWDLSLNDLYKKFQINK